jgi:hypothetical protein
MKHLMNHLWTFLGGSIAGIAVIMGSLLLAPHPATAQDEIPQPEQMNNVSPAVGSANTEFAFYAVGFDDGEKVDVWLNTPFGIPIDAEVEELYEANGNGRADWVWEAPEDVAPGMWQMVAQGRESMVLHVIPFEIQPGVNTGAEAPIGEEQSNVSPREGYPNTTFAFYASGFDPDEDVEIWLHTPNWMRIDLEDDYYVAPPSGRVDWTWTAPLNARPGTWHMVIQGPETKHVLPFEILPEE